MNLSFFTKIFGRSVQLSLSFPTLGMLVSTKRKCIMLIFIGTITLVPVAFLMALSIFFLFLNQNICWGTQKNCLIMTKVHTGKFV